MADDTISKSEFIDAMSKIILEIDEIDKSPYTSKEIALAMFEAATKNSNATKMSRKDFDSIDGIKLGFIIAFFNTDQNKSGSVDKNELKAYFDGLDSDNGLSEDDIKELFGTMDTDGNGELSMNEFIEYFLK
jgi:hypothetical protein